MPPFFYLMSRYFKLFTTFFYTLTSILALLFLSDLFIHRSFSLQRTTSHWFDPNVTSVYLIVFFFLGFCRIKEPLLKLNKALFLIVCLIVVLSAQSNEALVITLIFGLFEIVKNLKQRISIVICFATFFVIEWTRLQRDFDIRISIYKTTLKILSAHPLGIGLDHFPNQFALFRTQSYLSLKGNMVLEVDPHNLILGIICYFGFIFGSILLVLLIHFFVKTWRDHSNLRILISIFGIHTFIGINSFFINSLFGICFGLLARHSNTRNEPKVV